MTYLPYLEPEPIGVDWPHLMARCERRGIPVLRVDRLGNPHILRSVADLAAWEDFQ